ncbi:MAG: gamma-glutamyl-phosphate reductase, partial [Pirellulales bacterium]|nr:gamma-glutamyl-phosphate reductase [Pirellulales bacterium]
MSSSATDTELASYCRQTAQAAKDASYLLASLDTEVKNRWLDQSAGALVSATETILQANQKDLEAAPGYGLTDAMVDRLRLDASRIEGIAQGLREIALLQDPVGEIIRGFTRPGGLQIQQRRVPLGVVFFIYE